MKRRISVGMAAFSVLLSSWPPVPASAQQKSLQEQLQGAWALLSVVAVRPDGTKETPFRAGEGILMFDGDGHYSMQLCKQGRAKYISNNRLRGTPEEYQATAQGCNTYWGRYKLHGTSGALTVSIEHAMFPNLEGTEQTLRIKILGNELSYSSPGAAGGTADLVWQRAK